ncbi:hypothetical protein CWP99_22305, partial [Salmonella enterica]|nr:hypothetical protein [Salmonella enterica]
GKYNKQGVKNQNCVKKYTNKTIFYTKPAISNNFYLQLLKIKKDEHIIFDQITDQNKHLINYL